MWLIAFMVYLGLCLLVDIAYPVPIKQEKAQELYLEVSGSPVDEARRATAERTAMGAPLSSSRKGSATKKAKKKLDSIEGAGVFGGWFHTVMYLWAWIVAVSIFTLYWDIVYDGILLPALASAVPHGVLAVPVGVAATGVKHAVTARTTGCWACRASTLRRWVS